MHKDNREHFCEHNISRGNIKIFSGAIEPGDVFFALPGSRVDGHDFIEEALGNGADKIFCEKMPSGLSSEDEEKLVLCENVLETFSRVLKNSYNDPSSELKTFGVTGTNGKTTTVTLISSILNFSGIPCGSVNTIFNSVSPGRKAPSEMTTPGLIGMNSLLYEMVNAGCEAAAMEISSHALSQGRILGIGLDASIFTNLSSEHLDYHLTMDRYFSDKTRIFEHVKDEGRYIVNIDDSRMKRYYRKLEPEKTITYGLNCDADVRAENIRTDLNGIGFSLICRDKGEVDITCPLFGRYNVYNVLAASAATVFSAGVSISTLKEALKSHTPPPGRMEKIDTDAPYHVFIDYAHTPDALKNVLASLVMAKAKRIICVVGCGGERDKSKRPLMGSIATAYSHRAIFTSDNPRGEEPLSILRQMEKGRYDDNYIVIEDRSEAIKTAIDTAEPDDVVLIAGKGHEKYQEKDREKIAFDDKKIAEEFLRNRIRKGAK